MRILVRIVGCLICIGGACFFFLSKPIAKYDENSIYQVTKTTAGGSFISGNTQDGQSLNESENIGYGLAILILGCGIVVSLTKKEGTDFEYLDDDEHR